MALNISNFLRNKLLDKAMSGTNFTPAATLYVRLFSTTLDRDGVGTELANLGYTPLAITNNSTNFPAAAAGAKTLAVRHDFDPAEEDWDAILSIGLFDAASGGNLYFFENLSSPLTILNGQNIYFDTGGDMAFELS